jgi:hypothetical protein
MGHCPCQPKSALKCLPQLGHLANRRPPEIFFARHSERNRLEFELGPIGAVLCGGSVALLTAKSGNLKIGYPLPFSVGGWITYGGGGSWRPLRVTLPAPSERFSNANARGMGQHQTKPEQRNAPSVMRNSPLSVMRNESRQQSARLRTRCGARAEMS